MRYEIGMRIRKYRKLANLTQEQLGNELHVSKSRISNWEQGINRPDADILADLCRVLQISPSILLDVYLVADELSEHEKDLVRAYRNKPDMQQAVDVLLGLKDEPEAL